jgi:hypothetical protein
MLHSFVQLTAEDRLGFVGISAKGGTTIDTQRRSTPVTVDYLHEKRSLN